jgi:hypothetical protein
MKKSIVITVLFLLHSSFSYAGLSDNIFFTDKTLANTVIDECIVTLKINGTTDGLVHLTRTATKSVEQAQITFDAKKKDELYARAWYIYRFLELVCPVILNNKESIDKILDSTVFTSMAICIDYRENADTCLEFVTTTREFVVDRMRLAAQSSGAPPKIETSPPPSTPVKEITFVGKMDLPGSAIGSMTNVSGESISFETATEIGGRIFETCKIGDLCKVIALINDTRMIDRLISVERMAENLGNKKYAGRVALQSSPAGMIWNLLDDATSQWILLMRTYTDRDRIFERCMGGIIDGGLGFLDKFGTTSVSKHHIEITGETMKYSDGGMTVYLDNSTCKTIVEQNGVILRGSGTASSPPAPAVRPAPSFDCSKAATSVEVAICDDPHLAQLDANMAELYKQARNVADKKMLTEEQRQWRQQRNQCATAVNIEQCLQQRYIDRLQQLGQHMLQSIRQ